MCNSLRSAAPIRGRQSNRDADMLEILQSGGNKLRQFSYLLGGILLPRKCQLFELVKCGKLMLCHVLLPSFQKVERGTGNPIPRSHMLDQTVACAPKTSVSMASTSSSVAITMSVFLTKVSSTWVLV